MKISRDGIVPQIEPDGGRWANWQVRLGGMKRLLQSTNFPMQAVVVGNTSVTVWVTSQWLRSLFFGEPLLYAATVAVGLFAWLSAYYTVLMPGEQAWGQGQSQRVERSPIMQELQSINDKVDPDTGDKGFGGDSNGDS